jgi:branched-chain amino acid transport system substrate-binding protein
MHPRSLGLILTAALVLAACAPAQAPAPTAAPAKPTEAAKPADKPADKPAAAAASPAAAAKPASGTPLPMSGPGQLVGELQSVAVNMAVEKVNAEGGINGAPLQMEKVDAGLAPPEAVSAIRKLTEQDQVLALIGPVSSGQWEVGVPLVNQLEIPALCVNATKSKITAPPWAFRLVGVDDDMIPAAFKFFRQRHPDVKRVVVVGDVREASSEYAVNTSYPAALKDNGFQVVETIGFPTGTTDFAPTVTRIKGLNPEGLAISVFLAEGLALQKELEAQGVKVPTFVSPLLWAFPFSNLSTPAADGGINIGYYDVAPESPRPEARTLNDEFVKRAEQVQAIPKPVNVANAPIAYDAVMLYARIMREAGITPQTPVKEARTKIRDGLRAMKNYQGGGILYREFKPDGDVVMDMLPLVLDKQKNRWLVVRQ